MTIASATLSSSTLPGIDGLVALRDEWEALYGRGAHEVSLSYAWSHAVAALHVGPADVLRTIAVRDHGTLVAVLPLVARTARHAFCHVTPLAEEHNTHSDWLTATPTPAIAQALVDGLLGLDLEWDRFRMSRILDDHALLPLVVTALQTRGLRYLVRTVTPSYLLPLPSSYDAYLAGRSAKFRNHLKRVEKKLSRHRVEVRVDSGAVPADGAGEAFARILAVEHASWKHAHGWAMSSQPSAAEFWRRVSAAAWREGRIHVQTMTVDGQPAAYNLGYFIGETYSYLKTTYADAFRDVGAATFLRARLVEDLIGRGLRAIDFPGEPYDWEAQWTTATRGHVMLTAYSGTARSKGLELLERARHRGEVR